MITFGGRPLNTPLKNTNTYNQIIKGGNIINVPPNAVSVDKGISDVINVPPNAVSFDKGISDVINVPPNAVSVDKGISDVINIPLSSVSVEPRISNVIPSVSVGPEHAKVLNDLLKSDPIENLTDKQLTSLNKKMKKNEFYNRWYVKVFSAPVVITCMIIWWILRNLWTLGLILTIGIICYYLYEITQGLLDASHKLLDGVLGFLKGLDKLEIGFDIEGLFSFHEKIFGNLLVSPINKVETSNNSFPRTADVLAVDIIKKMMIGIADSLPGMLESVANVAGRAFL